MATGPIFFDLADSAGNGLALGGTSSTPWAWNLALFSNFMIIPNESSDLMGSGFSYSTVPSRQYFNGGNWGSSADQYPALTLVAGDSCGYYVMQNGLYLQSTPPPSDGKRTPTFSANKYLWQMKQTAGQAFQLQNADGSYVVAEGLGFSKASSAALGTIFEWVNGYIVIYNSLNGSGTTATVNYLTEDANGGLAVQSTANIIGILNGFVDGGWNADPLGALHSQSKYFPMTTTTTPSTLNGTPTLSDGAIVVAPSLSLVDPSKLFMYAACNLAIFGTSSTKMPYMHPTPYTFTNAPCPNTTGIIIGVCVGVGVLILIIAIAVYATRKGRTTVAPTIAKV